jgi:hypothetical protein
MFCDTDRPSMETLLPLWFGRMGEDSRLRSFWTSLPGILTGVAATIAAIGGILALALKGGDGHSGPGVTLASWARQANEFCSTADSQVQALNLGTDARSQLEGLPQTIPIHERANQQIEALDRPADAEGQIRQLLALASQSNVAASNASAWWRAGDSTKAQAYLSEAVQAGAALQRLDGELGANVCADPP